MHSIGGRHANVFGGFPIGIGIGPDRNGKGHAQKRLAAPQGLLLTTKLLSFSYIASYSLRVPP